MKVTSKVLLIMGHVFLFFIGIISCQVSTSADNNQYEMTNLQGLYFGQSLPGNIPKIFAAEIISAAENENYYVQSPAGDEVFFMKVINRNGNGFGIIYHSKLLNGFWTKPAIASFSGNYSEGYLAMHPDGSRLYFSSERPIGQSESVYNSNIWYVEKVNEIWGNPKPVGRPINGRNNTSGPSVTRDGTLYYTESRNNGSSEIYRSKYINGIYQEPEKLSAKINSSIQQFDSYIAPDESYLIYQAYLRTGSYGGTDLYISFRDSMDNWSPSVNMGSAINSSHDESSPTITVDKRYVFYTKYNNANNGMDIYWFNSDYLNSLK